MTLNRDGTVIWTMHPGARGEFADTPGAAIEAALAHIGQAPAVIIWNGRAPP